MIVSQLRFLEGDAILDPVTPNAWDTLLLDGEPRDESHVIECGMVLKEGRRQYREVDCPSWCSSQVLIVPDRARVAVEEILQGQYLPLDVEGHRFWAYNCLTLVDGLLGPNADMWRLTSGTIVDIRDYDFDPTRLEGLSGFKLSEAARGPLLFTGAARFALEQLGLSGLAFKTVWDSAAP